MPSPIPLVDPVTIAALPFSMTLLLISTAEMAQYPQPYYIAALFCGAAK
jgi:hypothetical protein